MIYKYGMYANHQYTHLYIYIYNVSLNGMNEYITIGSDPSQKLGDLSIESSNPRRVNLPGEPGRKSSSCGAYHGEWTRRRRRERMAKGLGNFDEIF